MRTWSLIVLGLFFVACCRTAPPPRDAATPSKAPAAVGACRDVQGPSPVVSPGIGPDGALTLTLAPATPIADDDVSEVARVGALAGSTTTTFTEIGNIASAPTPACVSTIVTPGHACLVAPTGRFWAQRSGHTPHGSGDSLRGAWQVVYELRADACPSEISHEDPTRIALVAGAHPAMRVVRFGFDVSYTTAAGGGGDGVTYDGRDLRPIIATWPAAEQALYWRGPGFAAAPSTTPDGRTITRDLTWFTTLDERGERWSSRLRDRDGKIIVEVATDVVPIIVRDGDALHGSGGRIR